MFQLRFPIFIEGHLGSGFYLIWVNLTLLFPLLFKGVTIFNIRGDG